MRVLLNVIWLILGGLVMALAYSLVGLVMIVLIVTIPFGIQSFKIAGFALWPFGRTLVRRPGAGEALSIVGNIIWLVLAGWWLAIGHLLSAFSLAITIIGLPLAVVHLKLIPISLWPFGMEVVSTEEARRREFGVLVSPPEG